MNIFQVVQQLQVSVQCHDIHMREQRYCISVLKGSVLYM